MFSQIFALSPGIIELNVWRLLLRDVVSELVVLLGLLALPAAGFLRRPDWSVLILVRVDPHWPSAQSRTSTRGQHQLLFRRAVRDGASAVVGLLRMASLAHRRVGSGTLGGDSHRASRRRAAGPCAIRESQIGSKAELAKSNRGTSNSNR